MYETLTIDRFEKGRVSKILSGGLLVLSGLKKIYISQMKARQAKADREVSDFVKNHADFERLQRDLTRTRTHALYYVGY